MKRIKLLQLVGKERRGGIFPKGIKEKDQTAEMKEDQITDTREGQIKEDKREDQIQNLQGLNVLVAMDMVT